VCCNNLTRACEIVAAFILFYCTCSHSLLVGFKLLVTFVRAGGGGHAFCVAVGTAEHDEVFEQWRVKDHVVLGLVSVSAALSASVIVVVIAWMDTVTSNQRLLPIDYYMKMQQTCINATRSTVTTKSRLKLKTAILDLHCVSKKRGVEFWQH